MEEIKEENEMIEIMEEQIDLQEEAKKATLEESNDISNEENVSKDEEKADNDMEEEKPEKFRRFDKKTDEELIWNEREKRYIRKSRTGKSAMRRNNQRKRDGPLNRRGAIATINKHVIVCFKIPQVLSVLARVVNYDACKLDYTIENEGFKGSGTTNIFTSRQPVRQMSCFVKVTPDDWDPETFDPHNLATSEGKYPVLEREQVLGTYLEITEKDINGEIDQGDEEKKDGENVTEEVNKGDGTKDCVDEKEDNDEKGGGKEKEDGGDKEEDVEKYGQAKGDGKRWENRNLPGGGIPEKKPWSWESPDRERLNLVFQGEDGFKVNGITCIKAHFADIDDATQLVPGSPDEFYKVELEGDHLFSFTGAVSPFPEDGDCVRIIVIPTKEDVIELNNGDLLGKVVLLQPRDVFGMKAFNFNMALVITTLWNPDPPKFLTKELAEETLNSEKAQTLLKEQVAEHLENMKERRNKSKQNKRFKRADKMREIQAERKKRKQEERKHRNYDDNSAEKRAYNGRWKKIRLGQKVNWGGEWSGPENNRFRNAYKADHGVGNGGGRRGRQQPRRGDARMPWDQAPDVREQYSRFGRGGFQNSGPYVPRYDESLDSGRGMRGFGEFGNFNGSQGGSNYGNSFGQQDYDRGNGYDNYNNFGNSGW